MTRSWKARVAQCLFVVGIVTTLAATASAVSGPTCVPANPLTCAQATGPEPPPPPVPAPGPCTFQVMMKSAQVAIGQGVSEGNLEISVVATADSPPIIWPDIGQQIIAPGKLRAVDRLLGSHVVDPGQNKTIDLCADVFEKDRGGLNGKSDVGGNCRQVQIACPLAPAPVPAREVPVRVPLCEGDKRDKNGVCKRFHGEVDVTFSITLNDEDGDGVPADKDMTPKPEDEACRGQMGRAVVLYSEFGGTDLMQLVQAVGMGIDNMVQGYDWVGIVMDPLTGPLNITIRPNTLAQADMVESPTLDGLLAVMRAAVSRGFDVTLIKQGHGNADPLGVAAITSTDADGFIDENEIVANLADPLVTGTCRVPIRAVHSLACYGDQFGDGWLAAGARVSGGPRFTNFYPQEQNGFARHWDNGDTFGDAVAQSLNPVARALNDAAVLAVGIANGCVNVLLPLPCAEAFFTTSGPASMTFSGNGRADYVSAMSGLDNMVNGSTMLIQGDPSIDKFTLLTW